MKWLITLFIAISFFACSAELSDLQQREIANEIDLILDKFMDAKTLSFETHTGLRADKVGYLMAGEGKIEFTNYKDYKEAMRQSFNVIQRFTEIKILKRYTYVLAKDAAVSTLLFESKFLTSSGDTLNNNGCWTFVFKKFDGQWKVIQENGTHPK